MNWGDCVILSGTSFDSANYTGCLVGGTPTEMQLFQGSELSAALSFIWAPPFLLHKTKDPPSSRSVSCIWEHTTRVSGGFRMFYEMNS